MSGYHTWYTPPSHPLHLKFCYEEEVRDMLLPQSQTDTCGRLDVILKHRKPLIKVSLLTIDVKLFFFHCCLQFSH